MQAGGIMNTHRTAPSYGRSGNEICAEEGQNPQDTRTNKCVRTNICKKSVFVVSIRNINICGRILTQFTGLLRTNTVAAKYNLLVERTGLENQFQYRSVIFKNGPNSKGSNPG